jgi:hypothetical protein
MHVEVFPRFCLCIYEIFPSILSVYIWNMHVETHLLPDVMTGSQSQLCLHFGIIPSTLSRYLTAGKKVLFLVLKKMPLARVRWPSRERMSRMSKLVEARQPALKGVCVPVPPSLGCLVLPLICCSSCPRLQVVLALSTGWTWRSTDPQILMFRMLITSESCRYMYVYTCNSCTTYMYIYIHHTHVQCISTCTYTNKHIHIYKRSGWLSGTFCSSIFLYIYMHLH